MATQRVHTAVGLFMWALVTLFSPTQEFVIASFFVIVLGSTLPDIDLIFKGVLRHRGVTHTIRAALLYSTLVVLASSVLLSASETAMLGLLAILSYSSHLLFDRHVKF